MPWRLMTIEEQRAHERERIVEYKNYAKSLDTHLGPVLDQVVPPFEPTGAEVAGQVVDTTKYKYDRIKVRGPDGRARYTAGNKDAVARSLLGMTKDQLFKVSKDNGLKLDEHFKLRNDGHFRMIVGQALRSIIIKGGKIRVGEIEISALEQQVPLPAGYVEEAKGTAKAPVRRHNSAYRNKD